MTVKMRVGFENTDTFYQILDLINHHSIDLLSLHGRTVKDMYHGAVKYDLIASAVKRVHCPVLANGNIHSATKALEVLSFTGAAGVMVGRWAVGNPWIFNQIRQAWRGETITPVPLVEVRNYIAMFVDAEGDFLRRMRQTQTEVELLNLCDRVFLDDLTKNLALAPSLSV
jgi:tRNA-dihydrouridine synthase